jgi:hypothetical protein
MPQPWSGLIWQRVEDHEVAGLLLIDSAHENRIRRLPASLRRELVAETSYRFCRLEAPMELLRSAGLVNSRLPIFEPESLRPMHAAAVMETRLVRGAGPYMQLDAPNAVADAIEEVRSMVGR